MLSTSLEDLVQRCAGGQRPVVIVTRTRRLARALRLRVAERRASDGVAVGEAPQIGTLKAWTLNLAERLAPGHLLLGSAVEKALWESTIAQAGGTDVEHALDLRALAQVAGEAFEQLCLWGEPEWELEPLARDAAEFCKWLALFRQRLAESKWIVASELPLLFARALESGTLSDARPASIAFAGFERLEPVVERIAAALANAGSEVAIVAEPAASNGTLTVRTARTRNDEIRGVAREIHARLLANPRLRIAVLAPEIAGIRSVLERVFEEELEAADAADAVDGMDEAGRGVRCFEVSAAPRMTEQPLIAHALDLLSLQPDAVSFELASRVLLAPYPRLAPRPASQRGIGDGEGDPACEDEAEFEARALAETDLRRRNLARVTLRSTASSRGLAAIARQAGAARFAQRLDDLAELLQREPSADRPGGWRVRFIHRLDAMKWPGIIDSEIEGILFRRWQDVLDELASMEVLRPSMTASEALAHLRSICGATMAQASSEGPPVQAMGLLDAAGLEFDVIYAIGMTSTAFPAAARPNPLLPVLWQRLGKHPRASAEGEREFAERVWRRVRASAPEVIASHALCDATGEQNSASALLCSSTDARFEEHPLTASPWWSAPSQVAKYREPYSAGMPAAVLARRGTAKLITDQAACPFWAFAAHRLGAERLRPVEVQPNASLRGNLVHAALEEVYRSVRDRQALALLDGTSLKALVEGACEAALAGKGGALDDSIRRFAHHWLVELVSNWLLYEQAERRDEWRIEEIERPRQSRLPHDDPQGIEFHVRLDRIDRLASGGLLLIDFKTSSLEKSATRWAGERPDEPQLPLYATLLARDGNRVEGLAFANLAARDKCSIIGLASVALAAKLGPGKGSRTFSGDFTADLATMQQSVDALARQYLAGDAKVAPKKPAVCRNCGMQSLCRVFENSDGDVEEDAAES